MLVMSGEFHSSMQFFSFILIMYGVSYSHLHKSQSREAPMILINTTVTDELGFVDNEGRLTTAWGASRFNIQNASTIVHMVNSMRVAKAFPMNELVILSMYGRRVALLISMFRQLAARLGLRHDPFPSVRTVDSFQSQEATMVIMDTTVTDRLGFVDNEGRSNMACTRGKDVLIIVGSKETRAMSHGNDKEEGKKVSPDQYTIQHRRVNDVRSTLPSINNFGFILTLWYLSYRFFHSILDFSDYISDLIRFNRAYEASHGYAELQKNFGISLQSINANSEGQEDATTGDDDGTDNKAVSYGEWGCSCQ